MLKKRLTSLAEEKAQVIHVTVEFVVRMLITFFQNPKLKCPAH
jgi:hypothetical protein